MQERLLCQAADPGMPSCILGQFTFMLKGETSSNPLRNRLLTWQILVGHG